MVVWPPVFRPSRKAPDPLMSPPSADRAKLTFFASVPSPATRDPTAAPTLTMPDNMLSTLPCVDLDRGCGRRLRQAGRQDVGRRAGERQTGV